jgi:fluoroacetyl-CoA thioesterase
MIDTLDASRSARHYREVSAPLFDRLSPGLRAEVRRVVTDDETAVALGSGDVPVLGTPAVLAMMERAACDAISGALDDGWTSVGTWVDLQHMRPSPVGTEVVASAQLVEVTDEQRVLYFTCEARDGDKPVAKASHRRIVVNRERFLGRG